MAVAKIIFNVTVVLIVLSSAYGSSIKVRDDVVIENPGNHSMEDLCIHTPCQVNETCQVIDGKVNCSSLQNGDVTVIIPCFHGTSKIHTRNGEKKMEDLQLDEEVASGIRPDGSFTFSPVIAFLHKETGKHSPFIQLTTDSTFTLLITNKHLIFRYTDESNMEAIHADKIQVGDFVHTNVIGGKSVVTDLKSIVLKGVYAPLTLDGTIVVNNILASCYAEAKSHTKSHVLFLPVRFHYYLKNAMKSISSLWNVPENMNLNKDLVHEDDLSRIETNCASGVFEEVEMHWYAQMLMSLTGKK